MKPVDLAVPAKDLEKSKAHYEAVKAVFKNGEQERRTKTAPCEEEKHKLSVRPCKHMIKDPRSDKPNVNVPTWRPAVPEASRCRPFVRLFYAQPSAMCGTMATAMPTPSPKKKGGNKETPSCQQCIP